ncbi:serine hydrolase domain-containing protein [Croceitalea rosinachiae]|uniref:Serine hydrolase n=1 Tax=Croceitalea rosinachiae TaxID=3075596 RepID=A0ABU3AAG8_9FLAO|nr:serine hydrolase [Croceitalea sp. F388]MDT0605926.1 serine hydrolase [Croceitalea sp. F388]
MKTLVILLVTALLVLSCQTQKESTPSPSPIHRALDSLASVQKESYKLPGLAVGIIKDDSIIYAKGFGVRSLNSQDAITTKSVFHMASVSKPFAATAIMQLVEKGKIDLDKPLVAYLSYFKMNDSRYKDITIRQMLNHTSGIADVEDYEWDNPQYDAAAAEKYIRQFSADSLDFAPGTSYDYSNAAFDILADVIAKVSGSTFEDYMKKHIFEPAGMINSTFYKPDVPEELATKPHVLGPTFKMEESSIYPYNRIHAPSSTLQSNVEDMMKWAQLYLNKGKIKGKQLFNESSYEQLINPQVSIGNKDSICLSWFSRSLGDYKKYEHNGGDDGFKAHFAFLPEKSMAIVVMTNGDYFPSWISADTFLELVLDEKPLLPWAIPIHLKLSEHILTDGVEECKEIYFHEKENNPEQYLFMPWCLVEFKYWLLDRNYQEEALAIEKFSEELNNMGE